MTVPWRQRLVHEGAASLRLDLAAGSRIRFDPHGVPGPADLVVLTWNEAERLAGVRAAIASGSRPRIVALPELLDGLAREGALDGIAPPCSLDGVHVEALPFRPVPWVTPIEGLLKARSALVDPLRAARRLADRARLPAAPPAAVRVTLPDGATLVHLGGALHAGQDGAWIADLAGRWAGADHLVAAVDYGHEAAVEAALPRFGARLVVLADLFGDVRRSLGMPTVLLTPIADRLVTAGHAVSVLASGTSMRFE